MPAPGFIYFATLEGHGRTLVKIGYAADPEHRVACLNTGSPFDIHLHTYFRGTKADERLVQARLAHHRFKREWFYFDEAIDDFLCDLCDALTVLRCRVEQPTIREAMRFADAEARGGNTNYTLHKLAA